MTATGLDVFDKTTQTTNIWLNEIMADLGNDRQVAWHVLGAVLHALRDRLPMELSAHLGAELPLLIRGLYYDQYQPAQQPEVTRSLEAFLERVQEGLKNIRPVDSVDATRSVFRVIAHRIDLGQSAKVREALPKGVQALWPESVGV
ncbi:DUF2267 domain-containing protein [Chelativorans sp. M5D2P16]|uniref:DUF2267 domain-containing protein n=1 Tax=Chelativorans sp. M5D2P16 TaxID=3095678 RepID=UPI002ACAA4A3|nr:DUF2267 domain-containing protein [Chelativorans sp. M5D2P16]MDZ5695905.1 DUF2267 domain-containing protein [Chelativorans sp. M5D2P16]